MTLPKISATVCISTFNRAEQLSLTLDSIKNLRIENNFEWELLLIDNNSTDNTKHAVIKYIKALPMKYIFEPKQGLSHARNRALQECTTEAIFFTDDDMIVDTFWLREFIRARIKFPDADFFGGRIIPYWPNGRPHWVKDESMALLAGLFGRYDLGLLNRIYNEEDPMPYGGNFGLRRRLFEQLEPFNTKLGVKGDVHGRGEEFEYLSRAKAQGFKGVYVGTAVCHHTVNPHHLRLSFLYHFGIQKGIAQNLIHPENNSKGSLSLEIIYGIRGMYQLLKGRGDRFRQCVINMGIQRGLRLHNKGL